MRGFIYRGNNLQLNYKKTIQSELNYRETLHNSIIMKPCQGQQVLDINRVSEFLRRNFNYIMIQFSYTEYHFL